MAVSGFRRHCTILKSIRSAEKQLGRRLLHDSLHVRPPSVFLYVISLRNCYVSSTSLTGHGHGSCQCPRHETLHVACAFWTASPPPAEAANACLHTVAFAHRLHSMMSPKRCRSAESGTSSFSSSFCIDARTFRVSDEA